MVRAALENGAGQVVVVDNGSHPASRIALTALKNQCRPRLTVLRLDRNQGSAKGYKVGISYAASQPECEFIWLLDDDNVPDRGALSSLHRAYGKMIGARTRKPFALLSLRTDLGSYWRKLSSGLAVPQVFPRKSSFRFFHFADFFRKFLRHIGVASGATPHARGGPAIKIPYGVWGGLFFHKSVVKTIGFPDERFYLYADDREYTYRFTTRGGGIYLIPDSKVHDIDLSEHNMPWINSEYVYLLYNVSEVEKSYYLLRNNAYFQKYHYADSQALFTLNKWIYFLILAGYSFRYGKWRRFFQILKAVRDGENCRLGIRSNQP